MSDIHNAGNQAEPAKGASQTMPQGIPDDQTASDDQQQVENRKANARTEAEAQSVDGRAGQSGNSSHDAMSHTKAGTHEGTGGGKKQERHH